MLQTFSQPTVPADDIRPGTYEWWSASTAFHTDFLRHPPALAEAIANAIGFASVDRADPT